MTIRVEGQAEPLIPAVRHELRALDPTLPVPSIVTAESRLSRQLGARRFQAQALGAFAVVALGFAVAGLYAALMYQVTLRRREIGIRTALGAPRRAIVHLFVRDGVALTLGGAAIGVGGALLARARPSGSPVSDCGHRRSELSHRRGRGRGCRAAGRVAPRAAGVAHQSAHRAARRVGPCVWRSVGK